jgi:hypothetical protein
VDHIFTTAVEPIILNYYNGTNIEDAPLTTIEEAIIKFYLGLATQTSGYCTRGVHIHKRTIGTHVCIDCAFSIDSLYSALFPMFIIKTSSTFERNSCESFHTCLNTGMVMICMMIVLNQSINQSNEYANSIATCV